MLNSFEKINFFTYAFTHKFEFKCRSCSICGKVSMIKRKNTRFKRTKRLGKRRPVF
ncbi:hypothetical protein CXB51_012872 [Gossypium anomalum]|uniref:Uncharacterized protein n=1 Tax=Gossypium anomalum TaxID=47600 RepID=A0A8J5Z7F1_9ROSI|nr:hypothetical protein CXB51_012872 [Gossypium anomalum]